MTLIELMTTLVVALLVLLMALTVFVRVRKTGYSASSSFVLGQDSALGFERLRQDLTETSLQSIRVAGEPSDSTAWVSMAGARDAQGQFQVTASGVPAWNQYVCYRLLPDSDGDGIANLVRFTVPQTFVGGMPMPAGQPPAAPAQVETVFTQIMAPGFKLGESSPGVAAPVADVSAVRGGFVVNFVRQDSMVPLNPNQGNDQDTPGWSRGSTGMLEVRLTMAERNASSGRYSLITLPIWITPRH